MSTQTTRPAWPPGMIGTPSCRLTTDGVIAATAFYPNTPENRSALLMVGQSTAVTLTGETDNATAQTAKAGRRAARTESVAETLMTSTAPRRTGRSAGSGQSGTGVDTTAKRRGRAKAEQPAPAEAA